MRAVAPGAPLFGLFKRKKPGIALKRLPPGTVTDKPEPVTRRKLIPQDITYEQAKSYAKHADRNIRGELAARSDVKPEILYFMAQDEDTDVRRAIASNDATPRQADLALARDKNDEVRCDLALKIGRLIPGISKTASERLQDVTLEVLEVLARDQLPRVRAIIAEEIKHAKHAPQPVVSRLARDVETIVAAPILEYSPLLSDYELMEIIHAGASRGGLQAIARRAHVSDKLVKAIVDANDIAATANLLANPNTKLKSDILDRVVDMAEKQEPLHEPLARRPELSVNAIRRIATFVSSSILNVLQAEHELDDETAKVVAEAVKKRIKEEGSGAEPAETVASKVAKLQDAGKLNEESILQAAQSGQRGFVAEALALKGAVSVGVVNKMLDSRSGKAGTAMAWKAGLSARGSMKLQQLVARVPANAMIHARDGVKHALSDAEMLWFLTYFQELTTKDAA